MSGESAFSPMLMAEKFDLEVELALLAAMVVAALCLCACILFAALCDNTTEPSHSKAANKAHVQ
jgi:H+/gluconate symporter-like permease